MCFHPPRGTISAEELLDALDVTGKPGDCSAQRLPVEIRDWQCRDLPEKIAPDLKGNEVGDVRKADATKIQEDEFIAKSGAEVAALNNAPVPT